ncbi:MAG: AAA family ATPase [Candidatus Wallbacteria bacterium]|nr:AAA family ATPase [Candidatus Wallbacteria bacterium]
MIRSLYIENFVLLQSQRLTFAPGLNVITGESGAGKTIILEALTFLFGTQAHKEIFYPGTDECYVEALIELPDPRIAGLAELPFISGSGSEIIVSRKFRRAGKSECYVDNRLVTLENIKRLRPFLLESCFRTDALAVYEPEHLLSVIDCSTGEAGAELSGGVSHAYELYASLNNELELLRRNKSDLERRRDFLAFQVDEIEKSGLLGWNEEELQAEYELLANFEELTQSFQFLVEFFNQTAAVQVIGEKTRALNRLKLPSRASELLKLLESVESGCRDFASASDNFLSSVQYDRQRLAELTSLMEQLSSLQRKYGSTLSEIAAFADSTRRELQDMESGLDESALREKTLQAEKAYLTTASELSQLRLHAAEKLESLIREGLSDIGLEKSRIRFERTEKNPGRNGFDRFQLLFSANPGSELSPLHKVASFGEQSRLLLALKTALLGDGTGTILFDEVEAGLGGKILKKTVAKLCELSKAHQVIAVTHSRELASRSGLHLLVEKEAGPDSTTLKVRTLTESGREKESARLLG